MSLKSPDKKSTLHFYNMPSYEERVQLLEKMSMLLSAGMPIASVLDSIKDETENKVMHQVITEMMNDIIAGKTLWKTLENRKIFPQNAISLIKIGEESGQLIKNINAITDQIHKEESFNSKIKTALFYPIFIIVLTIVIGGGISLFILPRIAVVFSSLDLELPLPTKILIILGLFFATYGYIVVPLSVVFGGLLIYFLFFHPNSKYIGEKLLLQMPVIRTMIKQNEIARLGFLLGNMLNSGIIITQALNSLEYSTTIAPYQKIYKRLRELIEEGNSFKKSFKLIDNISFYIPNSIQQMVVAAEQSGSTADTLKRIGEIYEEKAENSARNLSTALEPILILFVGIIVFLVAVSIIFPIYNLIGNINQ